MTGEHRETIQPVHRLRDILVKSTLSPSVAIPEGIQKIDLETFGDEAEGLLDRSIRDPKGLERGKVVYVTFEGKILFQKKDTVGSKNNRGQETDMMIKVTKAKKNSNLLRNESQNRFFAGIIHSHGVSDIPPSPCDFTPLFRNTDSIAVAPMLFVVTPQLKLIYFRSINTPQWDEKDVNQKVLQWTKLLSSNIQNKIRPGMPFPQQEGINAVETHNLIRSIRDEYHLKLYSCPLEKNIAVRESA